MEITIRVADKKDINELTELYQQLVEHEYSLDLPYKDMLKPFGNRLMQRAFQWGKDNNLSGAVLGAMEYNYGALNFYDKLGMYTTGRTLVKNF